MRYSVNVNGKNFDVEIKKLDGTVAAPMVVLPVQAAAPVQTPVVVQAPPAPNQVAASGNNIEVASPMPGSILKILVDVGQQVNENDNIIVMEAMKMEVEIKAPTTGSIKQILVNVGSTVGANDVLIVMN